MRRPLPFSSTFGLVFSYSSSSVCKVSASLSTPAWLESRCWPLTCSWGFLGRGLRAQPSTVKVKGSAWRGSHSYLSFSKKQKQPRGSRLAAENSSQCPATSQRGGRVQQLWGWLWHWPGRWRLCVSALHSCEDDWPWGQYQSDWGAGVEASVSCSRLWKMIFNTLLSLKRPRAGKCHITPPHSIGWLNSA